MTVHIKKSMVDVLKGTKEGAMDFAAAALAVESIVFLNNALRASGITQAELAHRLSVTPGRVSQVLNGDGNLRVSTLAKFLSALEYEVHLRTTPLRDDLPTLHVARSGRRARRKQENYTLALDVTGVRDGGVSTFTQSVELPIPRSDVMEANVIPARSPEDRRTYRMESSPSTPAPLKMEVDA